MIDHGTDEMNEMLAKLIGFLSPPSYESLEQAQKSRFLHVTLLITMGACFITGLLNIGIKSHLDALLFFVSGASLICIPLSKRGYYMPVAILISFLVLGVITFSMLGVGLTDAGLVAYPVFIIFSSYLLNKMASLVAVALSIGSVIFIYYLDRMGHLEHVTYSDENRLAVTCILLISTGCLLWVITANWEQVVQDLKETYDMTLSGWGKALEYRDEGTAGHSQRVVEMTLALAKRLGIPESKMEHIRRGALLHDIGKMAIPDAILLKNGSHTDSEREIMEMHPVYARNLLENIPYLKPALDIPYSHHERWDGLGYPEKLSGENIPIAARIFTVVDVWDALTSERPYHQAWPHGKARGYIQEQSGKMFDPRVVEAFMELLEGKKAATD